MKKLLAIKGFRYNYQIAICVACALLGFVISVLILNPKSYELCDASKTTIYGEVIIKNKATLVLMLLNERSCALTEAICNKELEITIEPIPEDQKIKEIRKRITVLQTVLRKTKTEIIDIEYGLGDKSLVYYSKYIFPDRTAFLNALKSKSWGQNRTQVKLVNALIVDTSFVLKAPISHSAPLELEQNKKAFLIDFVTDYPGFGLWIILTIAQMMLWFLLFPLLAGNIQDLKLKLGSYYCITANSILKNLIVPAAFIIIFVYALDDILADNTVIYDSYFLSRYNERFSYYAYIGYALAIYCFGTFLTLIRQVTDMDKQARRLKIDRKDSSLNDKYLALKEAFDNSFLASAIILSFLVLWVGVTINAINSTEAIKFYGTISGKPLIPQDFVYLMGLLHTIVLLSFYIPAKLKFNSISLTKNEDAATANSTPTRKIFRFISESLATLLITTSPLIASLIQKLLEIDPAL